MKLSSLPKLVVGLRPSLANIRGNNPKDSYGLAKVPFSLVPSTAELFTALALKHGARKYGPFNWRVEPVQGRVYLEAAKRHLLLLLDGEDFDRDTGLHHGCFVLANMAIYMDAMVHGTLIDNRALAGRTGDLVAFFNESPGQDRSRSELVAGFRRLIPGGHLLVDSQERHTIWHGTNDILTGRTPSQDPASNCLPKKGPTTKKPSDKGRRPARKKARHARS